MGKYFFSKVEIAMNGMRVLADDCWIISGGLLLEVLVLAGCGLSENAHVPQPEITNLPAVLYLIYPAGKVDPYEVTNGVQTVSLQTNHFAMLSLRSESLQRALAVEFVLFDSKGTPKYTNNVKPFIPVGSPLPFARALFQPDYLPYVPGLWKWVATVDGKTSFTNEFDVVQLDESDQARLLFSRKALEATARVFSYYWLGDGEYAYTGFITNDLKRRGVPEKLLPNENPVNGSLSSSNAAASERTIEPMIFLQVKSMAYRFEDEPVFSEADRANHVHYRGKAQFGFGIYRQYTNSLGWSDWEGKGPTDEVYGWQSIPKVPRFDRILTLEFAVTEKNGDWYIETENGDLFVNGRIFSRSSQDGSKWDRRVATLRPPRETIQRMLRNDGTNRVQWDSVRQAVPEPDQVEILRWLDRRELNSKPSSPITFPVIPPVIIPETAP